MTREEMIAILSVIESADYTRPRREVIFIFVIYRGEMSPALAAQSLTGRRLPSSRSRVLYLVQEEGSAI